MYNAMYFTYDGQWCGTYGLQIADFDNSIVKETEAFSPTLSLQKAPGSIRFFYGGIEYDSAPTCEFSVLSENELTGDMRSIILSWLIGRKKFKPIQFQDGDNDEFIHYCIFTSAKTIWVNGRCHGFRLTAQFNSPFARGESTIITIPKAGMYSMQLNNQSDIMDDYTYPTVTFTGGSIDIINVTDDQNRHFTFSGVDPEETVTVDNEVRHISSTNGGAKLDNFTSRNWLRLRKGYNTLLITASGEATITCPYYAMIGY